MKTKIVIICVISFMFFNQACKKKTVKEETDSPINITPIKLNRTDGLIALSYYYKISNDFIKLTNIDAGASFYKEAKPNDSLIFILSDEDVGMVKLNDHVLEKSVYPNNVFYQYFEYEESSFQNLIKSPRKWFVSGNGNYKQMQYIDYTPIPNYLSEVQFPDTIYVNQNNIIKFKFAGNFDSGAIQLYDPNDADDFIEFKLIKSSDTEAVFKKSDFDYFTMSYEVESIVAVIYLNKIVYREFEGKVIRFSYDINYTSMPIQIK